MTFAASALTGSYQLVGTLPEATRIIKFKNYSSIVMYLSWDGVNDHEHLQANEFLLIDVSANQEIATRILEIMKGQPFYVKGNAAPSGSLFISSYKAY